MEDAELTGEGQRVALQQRAGSLTEEAPFHVHTVPDYAALVSFVITNSAIKRLRGGFPATRASTSTRSRRNSRQVDQTRKLALRFSDLNRVELRCYLKKETHADETKPATPPPPSTLHNCKQMDVLQADEMSVPELRPIISTRQIVH